MKTLFLGAILLLLPNLLDACAGGSGSGKCVDCVSLCLLNPSACTAIYAAMHAEGKKCCNDREKFEDEVDENFLEIEAFIICEEDGDDGLTWKEVSECIESHQRDLAKLHGFHIPSKQDFDHYDVAPVDGKLFFDEWKSVHDLESENRAKIN